MSFEQVQKYDNLLSVFRKKSIANSDKPYLWSKQNSDYVPISWSETYKACLLYTSPSPRDKRQSRMPSSA